MRSLTANERAILDGAAINGLQGLSEYREQIAVVQVDYDPDYADVGLYVPAETPRLPIQGRFLPVNIDEIGEDGRLMGEILILLDRGYVCGIEYTDYVDDRETLPQATSLVFDLIDPNDRPVNVFNSQK